MSITPFPSQGQYPWYDQLEQWGADTQAAAENAKVAADQVHADVAASVNAANQAALDAQAAQVAATNAAGLVGTPPDAAIAAAVASPASQTAAEMTSRYARVESVDPRHGDGLADATSHIQTVINAANALGAGVYVPAGTYKVSAPLEDVRLMHLAEGAKLTAAAPGMAAVVRSKASSRLDNGGIVGKGVIDANTNATFGIHLRNFLYFEVSGISVTGGVSAGIKLGDSSASGRSAEAILSNVRIINNSANIIPASRGIWGENSGDHSISQVLIQNYEIGMELPIAGNAMVHDVHAWAEPSKGVMKCGFLDRSNNSHYSLCHADTPSEYGWRLYGYQTTLAQSGVF
ncbi:glycosyl hydrolase family 28-related protein, partial [Timonella senegalensis]|uniref:glycosyl hydrolase family 28-related protein n=1 Tax=Timonella senegalensis TaxID=1465825 RepID=UPI0028A81C75